MGHGIAQVLALAGHEVRLHDPHPPALARARKAIAQSLAMFQELKTISQEQARASQECITYEPDLAPACVGAEMIIESVPEELKLKRRVYASIEELVSPQTIIGTNTSALSISELAQGMRHPERLVGTHFWNPAQIMPCVEVIKGRHTGLEVFERVVEIMRAAGKEPVLVQKDVPGFLGNRLQHALQREALYLVEAGIASPEEVDRVVKYGFGLRLALMGPLERADRGGLDTTYRVQKYLLPHLDRRTQVSPLLEEQVQAGRLGLKTGGGFYDWPPEKGDSAQARHQRVLLALVQLVKELRDG